MTPRELAEKLRTLDAEATPGPWGVVLTNNGTMIRAEASDE